MLRYGKTVLLVSMVLGVIVSLFSIGMSAFLVDAPVSLINLAGFIAYLIVGTAIFRVSPMWPEELNWKWYLTCLLWGGCASVGVVSVIGSPISTVLKRLNLMFFEAALGGAYPEEISKLLGVALILIVSQRFSRPWHGFVVGGMVGLGFEAFENIVYGSFGCGWCPVGVGISYGCRAWLAHVFDGDFRASDRLCHLPCRHSHAQAISIHVRWFGGEFPPPLCLEHHHFRRKPPDRVVGWCRHRALQHVPGVLGALRPPNQNRRQRPHHSPPPAVDFSRRARARCAPRHAGHAGCPTSRRLFDARTSGTPPLSLGSGRPATRQYGDTDLGAAMRQNQNPSLGRFQGYREESFAA